MGAYDCDCINNLEYDRRERKAQLSQEGTTSDTISRQEVIGLLKQMRKDGDMVPWEGKNVFARIRKLPSAQPERAEGEWVYGEDSTADCVDGYRCSKCGFFVPWDYNHKFIDYITDYAYCPKCGARMKGERQK